MNMNHSLPLVAPRLTPVLDASFRPASLATRAFRDAVRASGRKEVVRLALEQADGSVFHFETEIYERDSAANFLHIERLVKFLLWSRGGWRIYIEGADTLAGQLAAHFSKTATGQFDSNIIGEKIFDHAITVTATRELPPARSATKPLGRHLNGCRIGFDLGGSDRKVAAVIDGKVVFSEETVWDPYFHPDPQYHFDGIMDSLRKAAAHLPHVRCHRGECSRMLRKQSG